VQTFQLLILGYGGKFGVEKDRMDKSALGHDFIGKVEKHASQNTSHGFGGKFGVETDRVDVSAVGFDYKSKLEKHESQNASRGFGGKFGVETDRMDKSAVGFQDQVGKIGTNYSKIKPDISGAKPSNLKAKFENFAIHSEEEAKERLAQQKRLREEKDKSDREQATKEQGGAETKEPAQNFKPQRSAVVTGRDEKISSAINVFNAPKVEEEKPMPVRQPLKIQREEVVQQVKPDIIASTEIRSSYQEEVKEIKRTYEEVVETVTEPIAEAARQESFVESEAKNGNDVQNVLDSYPSQEPAISEQELIEQLKSDNIEDVAEEQQFVLSPDDPGVMAYALFDYQAAAEDEISFDPEDLITHIEMIDEGWWKGLHAKTVTYGLFPANYVQLKE
jgi:cortactin